MDPLKAYSWFELISSGVNVLLAYLALPKQGYISECTIRTKKNLVSYWKSQFQRFRLSILDLLGSSTHCSKIRDPFFLLPNVCIVMGDICNFSDIIGGMLVLNKSIHICWTSSSPAQWPPGEKTMAILKGVHMIEALHLSNI